MNSKRHHGNRMAERSLRMVSGLACAAVVAACGGGGGADGASASADDTLHATIGPKGGELVGPAGSDGVNIGIHRGQNPPLSQPNPAGTRPGLGSEAGSSEDLLDVYLGSTPLPGDARNPTQYPLDEPPAWSYTGTDALKSPNLEAVAQFRKAVEAAEKKKP